METGTNQSNMTSNTATTAKPIGGWLILVGIGLLLKPFYLFFSLYPLYREMFAAEQWEILRTAGRMAYGPFFIPFIYAELILNILVISATLYLICLFFRRDHRFPNYFIAFMLFNLLFVLLDAWIGGILTEETIFDAVTLEKIKHIVIPSLIWIPYIRLSQRVKETFIKK